MRICQNPGCEEDISTRDGRAKYCHGCVNKRNGKPKHYLPAYLSKPGAGKEERVSKIVGRDAIDSGYF